MNDTNKITVSKQKKSLALKKSLAIIVSLLLLIGTTFFILYKIGILSLKDSDNNSTNALVETAQKKNILYDTAAIEASKDYNSGQKVLADASDNTVDKADQAWLLIQRATLALNSKKYSEAYNYSKQSEAIIPSQVSAQLMGESLVELGRSDEAILSYKLAISRMTVESNLDKLDRQSIIDKITNLGGSL